MFDRQKKQQPKKRNSSFLLHVVSNFNILKTNTFSACWVIWCFHSPPNSDVDYRIRNMHIWLFCMHICCFSTHHHITFDEVEIHKNLRTGMHITCDRLQKCVCVITCKEKKKIVQNLHWSDSLHAQSRINLSLLARYLRPLRCRVNSTCSNSHFKAQTQIIFFKKLHGTILSSLFTLQWNLDSLQAC